LAFRLVPSRYDRQTRRALHCYLGHVGGRGFDRTAVGGADRFRHTVVLALLVLSIASVGCAKRSENVAAAYVSPLQYEKYTCRQLAEEAERISMRASQLSGVQDRKRTGDVIATTAAIVVFWPAAFLVGGDDAQTAELARLKGEFDALQKVSVQKGCTTRFEMQRQ
jgi:hypothetical protein